jgi:hypothetical protein
VDSRFNTRLYTASGGNVVSWTDHADATHVITQPTAGLRVPIPTPDSALLGGGSSAFSAHWYESNRAASAWKWLHDGSDCEVYVVFVPTTVAAGQRQICGTCRGDTLAGDIGFEFQNNAATALCANINEAATPLILAVAAVAVAGTPFVYGFRGGTAQTPDGTFTNRSATVTSANYGSAVSAANPTGTLRLGAAVDGSKLGAMRWAELLIFKRVLQSSERSTVMSYFQFEYGIT